MLSLMALSLPVSIGCRLAGPAQDRELRGEIRKSPGGDGLTEVAHQLLIVVQIVPGQEHRAQDLLRLYQMVDIAPGVVAAGRTAAGGIDRARVARVARIAHVELPEAREGRARAAAARWHDAVEHVDPALNRAQDVLRPADPHEIARAVVGQE